MLDPQSLQAGPLPPDKTYRAWQTAARQTVMRLDPQERTAGPMPFFGKMVRDSLLQTQSAGLAYAPEGADSQAASTVPALAYQNDRPGMTFDDVVDMINPLQHLPVIGTLYRKLSGDTLSPISNIIGGALFGGPVGAVASTVNVIVKDRTGRDVTENAFSMVGIETAPRQPEITYSPIDTSAPPTSESARANAAYTAAGMRNFAAQTVTRDHGWNV